MSLWNTDTVLATTKSKNSYFYNKGQGQDHKVIDPDVI